MRFFLLPIAVCVLTLPASAPAGAEDFTGFYAGVNAGYAIERNANGASLPAASTAPAFSDAGTDLPPSALGAVGPLRSNRDGARRRMAAPR